MAVRDVVQAAAGVGGAGEYVEDVFSTYLYTGNGSAQTINNGIDLDGEGGLVWTKARNLAVGHYLVDTERGVSKYLLTNGIAAEGTSSGTLDAFNSNGYSLGSLSGFNGSGYNYASWTFRKAPKFFDVVTYAGNSVGGRQIPHNLGSVPGMVIVKNIDAGTSWRIWHRAVPGDTNDTSLLSFTTSPAELNKTNIWAPNGMTDSYFTVSTTSPNNINETGYNYVAYFFAHDAGGFGDDGEQNVISCGSYTGNGSANGTEVNLGYEPQWLLIKNSTFGSYPNWFMFDNMRGMTVGNSDPYLYPNLPQAEAGGSAQYFDPTATGFKMMHASVLNETGQNYIYIAIRRPMKTPESGTEVFHPFIRSGNDTQTTITGAGFAPDLWVVKTRNLGADFPFFDRLRGVTKRVASNSTYLEETFSGDNGLISLNMDGITIGAGPLDGGICNDTGANYGNWLFRRAPGFMDLVAYTGTGVAHTEPHNLGVAPEMMIVKTRSTAENWIVYHSALTATSYLNLNTNGTGGTTFIAWDNTEPTATNFTVGLWNNVNGSGVTNIAYLFASLPGVSKVGSYSGTGGNVNVDCGFSAGARFILIKRTDSTGDWYVWDSVRGIVAGNDPYLLLNSTAAEVTSTDYIDPLSSGFTVTSSAPAALNASGGSFIFLAIA